MKNGKNIDISKLTLGVRKELIKADLPGSIEIAIKKIHDPQPVKEETTRITIDVSVTKHKKIIDRIFDLKIKKINRYILCLIDKDLNQ